MFAVGAAKWEGKSVRGGRWREERHFTRQGQQKALDDIWSEVGRWAGKFFLKCSYCAVSVAEVL